MPTYTYRCPRCQAVKEVTESIRDHDSSLPPLCFCERDAPGNMRRDYQADHPRTATVFPVHFNPTVGRVVTSQADFNAALREGSDRAEEATGIPHRFVPIHPSEAPNASEAREWNYRRAVVEGRTEAQTWHHS